ncbi:MAG: acetamidase/formamidase family protein [Planctomycetota bacterium]|jgi:acetamidase/formamidase|nr:acetamidase/formamidase family protein [Planctomycetota bacterium]
MKHHLTEKIQTVFGYSYTIGPYNKPVMEIQPGDTVIVETLDCFEGKVTSVDVKPSTVATIPFLNPQNGPILVKGAEPGDALAVHVESIVPRGPQPCGTTCLQRYFGALTPTARTLSEPFPEMVKKVEVTGDGIVWNKKLTIPYQPFIGTIGTAPLIYSVDTLTPGNHGGNMDLPDVAPGATVYLPIRKEGAYLYLGDCHAAQGDGELCGVAIEYPTTTTVKIDLVKGWTLDWPLLENDEFIMATGSVRPLEDAVRLAYDNLIGWMVDKYGFDKWDAYFLVTQVGRVRVGNVVDPNFTAGASISKKYLVPGGA